MRRETIVFASILGLALAIRLVLALTYSAYWGVDGGASLLTVNAVLGDEPTGAGFPKPPLAPGWLLAPFVLIMGADTGYKVWSAVFSILPIVPVFLLTRHYVNDRAALLMSVFAAVDITWAEMFVTGAHPLPAFTLLGLAWWNMAVLSERVSFKHSVSLTLCVGLIPWINQTAASLALITLPIVWFSHYILAPSDDARGSFFWRTAASVFLGGMLGVAAMPWYLKTLPGSPILTFDGPIIYWAWTWATFQFLFLALPLGLFVLWRTPRNMKYLGVLLLVLGFMGNWMSFDEVIINPLYRARYVIALAFYPAIAWVVWRYWLHRVNFKLAWAVGSVAFVYFAVLFTLTVRLQNEYSLMVTPETTEALESLQGDPNGIATNSFTLSLWVAAMNKVHSPFAFTAPPPPAYIGDDKDLRCLYNWVEGCNPQQAAERLGVKYLLVEERFPYYNEYAPGNYMAPPNQWERTAEAPWLKLVYEEGTTKLWEINQSELASQ